MSLYIGNSKLMNFTTVVGNKVTVDYTTAGGTTDEEVKIVVKCVEDNTKTATGTYTIA